MCQSKLERCKFHHLRRTQPYFNYQHRIMSVSNCPFKSHSLFQSITCVTNCEESAIKFMRPIKLELKTGSVMRLARNVPRLPVNVFGVLFGNNERISVHITVSLNKKNVSLNIQRQVKS